MCASEGNNILNKISSVLNRLLALVSIIFCYFVDLVPENNSYLESWKESFFSCYLLCTPTDMRKRIMNEISNNSYHSIVFVAKYSAKKWWKIRFLAGFHDCWHVSQLTSWLSWTLVGNTSVVSNCWPKWVATNQLAAAPTSVFSFPKWFENIRRAPSKKVATFVRHRSYSINETNLITRPCSLNLFSGITSGLGRNPQKKTTASEVDITALHLLHPFLVN